MMLRWIPVLLASLALHGCATAEFLTPWKSSKTVQEASDLPHPNPTVIELRNLRKQVIGLFSLSSLPKGGESWGEEGRLQIPHDSIILPLSQVFRAKRKFTFAEDTFAFANELFWEYQIDPETGQMTSRDREPPPQYVLRCFVVSRSARQFFQHARFDASKPQVSEQTYRLLIRKVVGRSPRNPGPQARFLRCWPGPGLLPDARIVIPGFSNLREFSQAHEKLLKAECGGAWQSYFQRGHWRMVFPFTRSHQERMAAQLAKAIERNSAPVVHLVRFPKLTINHAMLLFDFAESGDGLEFLAYDPNDPEKPVPLRYEHRTRTFTLPNNSNFSGGRVDVYEVYHAINY